MIIIIWVMPKTSSITWLKTYLIGYHNVFVTWGLKSLHTMIREGYSSRGVYIRIFQADCILTLIILNVTIILLIHCPTLDRSHSSFEMSNFTVWIIFFYPLERSLSRSRIHHRQSFWFEIGSNSHFSFGSIVSSQNVILRGWCQDVSLLHRFWIDSNRF